MFYCLFWTCTNCSGSCTNTERRRPWTGAWQSQLSGKLWFLSCRLFVCIRKASLNSKQVRRLYPDWIGNDRISLEEKATVALWLDVTGTCQICRGNLLWRTEGWFLCPPSNVDTCTQRSQLPASSRWEISASAVFVIAAQKLQFEEKGTSS